MPRPPSSSSSCELPPRVAVSILHENARVCEEYFKRSVPSSNEDGMPIVRRTSQLPFDADSDSVAETCVAHGRSEECPRLRLMRTAAAICVAAGRSEECPWKCVQQYNKFVQQRRAAMQSQRLAASRVAMWWFLLSASEEQLEQHAVASGENYQKFIELQARN